MAKNYYDEQGRELLEHGSSAFPIAIYEGNLRKDSVPVHWHNEFEAGYVIAGEVCLIVGADRVIVHEGEAFFINVGALHAFCPGAHSVSLQRSMVFDPSLVGGRTDSVFWQKYCQPFLAHADFGYTILKPRHAWQADCISNIVDTWDECSAASEEYELDVRHSLSHILSVLCHHLNLEGSTVSEKSVRDSTRMRSMLQYIHENYMKDLSVSDVAASAMISHSEALRCFHDTIGMTPLRYIRDYRIQKAAEMLAHSRAGIGEAAAACGFSDVSYFTRIFRETKGCTPGDYRKNA